MALGFSKTDRFTASFSLCEPLLGAVSFALFPNLEPYALWIASRTDVPLVNGPCSLFTDSCFRSWPLGYSRDVMKSHPTSWLIIHRAEVGIRPMIAVRYPALVALVGV